MVDFIPVDHDPFTGAFGTGTPQEEATRKPSILDKLVSGAIQSMVTLPQRAFESSESLRRGEGYDPGPALEAAMLPMGTGAIAGLSMRAGEMALGSGAIRTKKSGQQILESMNNLQSGPGNFVRFSELKKAIPDISKDDIRTLIEEGDLIPGQYGGPRSELSESDISSRFVKGKGDELYHAFALPRRSLPSVVTDPRILHYQNALKEGKITKAEYNGFMEALGKNPIRAQPPGFPDKAAARVYLDSTQAIEFVPVDHDPFAENE